MSELLLPSHTLANLNLLRSRRKGDTCQKKIPCDDLGFGLPAFFIQEQYEQLATHTRRSDPPELLKSAVIPRFPQKALPLPQLLRSLPLNSLAM